MNLPPVSSAFRWVIESCGPGLRSVGLERAAQHVFTTKQLQLHGPDDATRWALVARSCGASLDRVVRIKQVHGDAVRVLTANELPSAGATRPEADAMIANTPGALLVVQVADCVPVLVVDPRLGAAGAIHAGWRGTCAGIARVTIERMAREFGSRPADLQVAIGPSIGACCYEVGADVLEAFRQAGRPDIDLARWFTRSADGSLRLDLWAANCHQLAAAGVPRANIFVSRLCTRTHADIFDSYRAAGPRAGRSVAAIRVPTAAAHL